MEKLFLKPKRVLVIDDNPEIHRDYLKILQTGNASDRLDVVDAFLDESFADSGSDNDETFELKIDSAFQGQEALEKVIAARDEGWPYSMAFVDMRMPPGWDGLTTIEEVWKECPDLQVVICTAYSDNSWKEIMDRLGRTDKLLILKKPFDRIEVSQLAVALTEKWELTRKAEMKQRDLENLVEERTQELKRAAMHDPLTDLPNRKLFHIRLVDAIQRSKRYKDGAAVILLDLDRFKSINDSFGHPCGDKLLIQVAERIQNSIRATDTVARLGGDEFAIIRTDVRDQVRSGAALQRIVDVLSQPYLIDGNEFECGASMGVALIPEDGIAPEDLIRKADLALYRAKQNGRCQFCHYDQHMDAEVTAVRKVESDLRAAVAREEFCIHYQPIVNRDGEVSTLEALVRWDHPERGLIYPDEFIQVAEDTGLIVPIGALVLREACAQAMSWPSSIRLAVNVSATQLASRISFDELVLQTLEDTQLDPDRLELEITESVLIRECEEITETLRVLRNHGVRIVLDDFGVGFSSLAYLHSFAFDKLKLDRTFVMASDQSEDARVIVRAVAGLGVNLAMETAAEGVETLEQFAMALSEGFSEFQGFLLSKPQPIEDLRPLIEGTSAELVDIFRNAIEPVKQAHVAGVSQE